MLQNEKKIAKRKSEVKKNTLNPFFNDTFEFNLPHHDENALKNTLLDFTLLDWNRLSKNQIVGHVTFGTENAESTAIQHWNEIIATPYHEIEKWHKLCQ